ncbi:MAG: trypsin-like peptidase domain-containing protein [Gemmatimonadota bacterium]
MFDPLKLKTRILIYTVTAFALGLGGASLMGWTSLTAMPAIQQSPQVPQEAIQPALDLSNAFMTIAEAVTPAVVRIEAERPTAAGSGGAPSQIPEPFREFFPDPDQAPPNQPPFRTAGGSGFIVSEDGYILTNDHVVSGATRIRVYLPDRREYAAEVVGTDPTTDVAVIKIEDGNLPTLSLGSSGDVRVGEWILAIGNPGLGSGGSALDYTVTSGIVSAIGRPLQLIQNELRQDTEYQEVASFAIEDFIQTDAVINPGNSGGPMVNVNGQVVGINSAIASRTGYYQGYGFAIPIDLARRIMEDLVEYGEVRRAYLGVAMRPVEPVDAELYGLPRTMGAFVNEVVEGTPAAQAGLQQEDVIVAVNGVDVERPGQLQVLIAQRRPGDEVTVEFYRNGERRDVTVELEQAPLAPRVAEAPQPEAGAEDRIGIQVEELGQDAAASLGYESPGGVVISGVSPTGPAGRAGVPQGVKLNGINRETIEDVSDVSEVLAGVEPGGIVTLRLEFPDESTRIVNLRVPE